MLLELLIAAVAGVSSQGTCPDHVAPNGLRVENLVVRRTRCQTGADLADVYVMTAQGGRRTRIKDGYGRTWRCRTWRIRPGHVRCARRLKAIRFDLRS